MATLYGFIQRWTCSAYWPRDIFGYSDICQSTDRRWTAILDRSYYSGWATATGEPFSEGHSSWQWWSGLSFSVAIIQYGPFERAYLTGVQWCLQWSLSCVLAWFAYSSTSVEGPAYTAKKLAPNLSPELWWQSLYQTSCSSHGSYSWTDHLSFLIWFPATTIHLRQWHGIFDGLERGSGLQPPWC